MKKRRSIVVDTDQTPPVVLPPVVETPTAPSFMAVVGFAKMHNLPKMSVAEASGHGKTLARISREGGYPVNKIPHEQYGTINAYSVELMKAYFKVT